MYRGTTPTITINCDIDASEFVTMWVTFRVQKRSTYGQPQEVEITKRLEDEGVDVDGQVISITLTQADTLLLGRWIPKRIRPWRCRSAARRQTGGPSPATL